jgi:hypothetical protein
MPSSSGGSRVFWTKTKPNGSTGYTTRQSILESDLSRRAQAIKKPVQGNKQHEHDLSCLAAVQWMKAIAVSTYP